MPRRRMLDPSFFEDTDVARLTRDERPFLLGCIRNADDEGRLKSRQGSGQAAGPTSGFKGQEKEEKTGI